MATKHREQWIWQLPRWPEFTWDAAALTAPLGAARRAQGELSGAAQFLDASMNQTAQLEALTTEGIATSAIEGETFDPNSLRSSLARRLGLPTSGMPPSTRAVEGLADVLLEAAQRYEEPLTLMQLSAWQAALFPTGRSGLHEIRVGVLRGNEPMRIVSGPIEREHVHYVAPPRERLDEEMQRFLSWFNQRPISLDGLIRAGLAHAWFELIHPFEDGNGRIGRALLDRALAQDEHRATRLYSLSARLMTVRDEYYLALEHLSKGNLDVTAWLIWFLAQFTMAVRRSDQTIAHVLRKAHFWARHAQSPLNDRQRKALNSMLDAGPDGFVGGMTNRKYANLTKTSTATAQRDLADLVQLGCLEATGAGRSAHYVLRIPK
jgi:Fic family protein